MNNNEIPNQELWNTFQTLKTDNYKLRKEIIIRDRVLRSLRKESKMLKKELKKLKKEASKK